MAPIKLAGGYYQARSLIANAQRCVNLFPEKNPDDAPFPYTLYPTSGLTLLTQAAGSMWRGLYFTSTGVLIGVLDNKVYSISSSWTLTQLGVIGTTTGPVSIYENGIYVVIGDGSASGWTVLLSGLVFAPLSDPTGTFVGTTSVDFLDTYLLFNQPGTRNFYSSLSNEIAFDPLFIAAKTTQPDLLQKLLVVHKEFLLIGQRTTEVWYDAGNANFPFASVPGVFLEVGTSAQWSPAKHDLNGFWLGQARDGMALVIMYNGYAVKSISTPAISNQIGKYSVTADAQGFCFREAAHVFYVLTFPTADKTWTYDMTEGFWHERVSLDPATGSEHRWRVNCVTQAYGVLVGGDFANGKLYQIDQNNPTEDGLPIIRRRGLPHLTNEGKYLVHDRLRLDVETGTSTLPSSAGFPGWWPEFGFTSSDLIALRWSDDRGRTWQADPRYMPLGAQGQTFTYPQWTQLGTARDRVYELFWTSTGQVALNGAYADITPGTD